MKSDHGFDRKVYQYQYRCGEWGFRKNLKQAERESVYRNSVKRKAENQGEQEVLLNGVPLSCKKIKRLMTRVPLSCEWTQPTIQGNAIKISEAVQLIVSKPIITKPLPLNSSWFGRLPWFQFSKIHFPGSMHIDLTRPDTMRSNLPFSSFNGDLCHMTPKAKAYLQKMIPEEHDGDHDKTVAKLKSNNLQEIEWEAFKILLYKLSNNMQVGQQPEDGLKDDVVLKTVKLAAQRDPEWFASVAASDGPTATAIAGTIFAVAIRQCDVQITSQLLKSTLVCPDGFIQGQLPDIKYGFARGSSTIQVSFTPQTFFCTPLQRAASAGKPELMKALISAGAKVDLDENCPDLSSLELACLVKPSSLAIDLVRILLTYEATINRPATTARPTALMLALSARNAGLVELLIAHGADTQRIYRSEPIGLDLTACRLAILSGDLQLLEALMTAEECRQNLREDTDLMVLAVSAKRHHSAIYLRDAGVNPTTKCSWGEHPLTTAIFVEDLHEYLQLAAGIKLTGLKAPYNRPTPMHAAAFKGNAHVISCLYQQGLSLTTYIKYGTAQDVKDTHAIYCTYTESISSPWEEARTPLQVALYRKHTEAALTILHLGGNKFYGGEVALAAALGSVNLVNMLIDLGASLDECWLGTTPIQAALEHGHDQIAYELVKRGASIVGGEWTRAIMCRNEQLIWLIVSKATPQQLRIPGPRSETPLEAACATGNLEVIDFILIQPWAEYDSAALCAAVWYAKANYTDDDRPKYGCVVKRLLKRRNRASEMDTLEATALAASVKYRYFYQELLYILLGHLKPSSAISLDVPALRTTVKFWWRSENRHGMSPLHIGVDETSPWVVKVLLSKGFRPDEECFLKTLQLPAASRDASDIATAIWNAKHPSSYDESWVAKASADAVKSGHAQMVERLLELGLQVDSRTSYKSGWTALQLAALSCDSSIIQRLITAGANVNAPPAPEAGATALQAAAIFNRLDIVRILLEHGADVNTPGARNSGRTALEGAAEFGRLDMVQLLLYKGAMTESRGRLQYIRAVKFAQKHGHHAVAGLLKRHRDWTDEDFALMNSNNLEDTDDVMNSDDLTNPEDQTNPDGPMNPDTVMDLDEPANSDDFLDFDNFINSDDSMDEGYY
ncbi:hypothetical protein NUW58_g3497 [Xylaria curta]|uniref:Uncharacterized protein n=1 Tax=Xylaria curta TaxID=42375 RepID=A0ACC1PCB9_9PEZI|nr:hypothetical protein NUW58_g3497 [Xylaria curta]